MGTITYRTGRWKAQARKKRGGRIVNQATKTFDTAEQANEWCRRIELQFLAGDVDPEMAEKLAQEVSAIPVLPEPVHPSHACGVYFLFKGSECIYVGQSRGVHDRVAAHRSRIDFDSYTWTPVAAHCLNLEERRFIDVIRPRLNKLGNPDATFLPRGNPAP